MVHVVQSRVLLRPRDFASSVDFYEHRLGMVRYREWGDAPHRGVVFFLGGGFLELTEGGGVGASRSAGLGSGSVGSGSAGSGSADRGDVRLWLQVADAAAAAEELAAAGIAIDEPPERKPWGLIELVVRDPDGLPLVVVETPLDHPLRRRE